MLHDMNKIILFAVCASLPFAVVSCGDNDSPNGGNSETNKKDTHESLAKEFGKLTGSFIEAVGSMTDEASVDKGIASIKETTSKLNDLKKRLEKLGKPEAELAKKIAEMMKEGKKSTRDEKMKMMAKFGAFRQAEPELAKKVDEHGEAFEAAMKSLQTIMADYYPDL